MTKLHFVGLDCETTGSHPKSGEVASQTYQLIQIGLAVFDAEGELQTFSSDVGYDEWNSEQEAMDVNKFTPERIKAGPKASAVDTKACEWLDAHVGTGKRGLLMVGLNVAGYDMPFVRQYLPKMADRFSYRSVDLNAIIFAQSSTDDDFREFKSMLKNDAVEMLKAEYMEPNWHDAQFDAAAALMMLRKLRIYLGTREE